MIKLFSILKRRSDLTQGEFVRYWKETHGPLAAKLVPGLRRYVQCHPVSVSGAETNIDGIAELWFDDVQAVRKYWIWRQSDAAKQLREDEGRFAVMTEQPVVPFFFAEEHIVKEK